MCQSVRNPLHCILPPYIADKMPLSDLYPLDESLDNALRNHRFRSDRKFFATLPKPSLERMLVTSARPKKPTPKIEIYNLRHKYSLPGKLMTAAQVAGDADAKNVQRAMRRSWTFYHAVFGRNSIDNEGLALVNSIHYGKRYNNAMWNGRQMIYGDGDKKVFGSFTADLDIIAHELAHGVTQYAANFDYAFQSGALNESFSDVFGILVKQHARRQMAEESNWLIGEQVMLGGKYALRSMAQPGKAYIGHPIWGDDPQPATMDAYWDLPNTDEGDYGGVHINSGIPNYAFYIAAMESGGYAWETAGKAWYAAWTESLDHKADFRQARDATIAQAARLFGKGSKVHKAVQKGWRAAKVK